MVDNWLNCITDPDSVKTGMDRDLFNNILLCQQYSKHPITRQSNYKSEKYIWMMVDYHVKGYNKK